jgi:hypothetical protein
MNSVTTLMTSHNTVGCNHLTSKPTYSTDHELCHHTDDVTQHCKPSRAAKDELILPTLTEHDAVVLVNMPSTYARLQKLRTCLFGCV